MTIHIHLHRNSDSPYATRFRNSTGERCWILRGLGWLLVVVREAEETMDGTLWVIPGEGSTVQELMAAFGFNTIHGFVSDLARCPAIVLREDRTNLLLTGAVTDYDYSRLQSDHFRIGKS